MSEQGRKLVYVPPEVTGPHATPDGDIQAGRIKRFDDPKEMLASLKRQGLTFADTWGPVPEAYAGLERPEFVRRDG